MTPEERAVIEAAERFCDHRQDSAGVFGAVRALRASRSPLPSREELRDVGYVRSRAPRGIELTGAYWLRWVADNPGLDYRALADELEWR